MFRICGVSLSVKQMVGCIPVGSHVCLHVYRQRMLYTTASIQRGVFLMCAANLNYHQSFRTCVFIFSVVNYVLAFVYF